MGVFGLRAEEVMTEAKKQENRTVGPCACLCCTRVSYNCSVAAVLRPSSAVVIEVVTVVVEE